MVGPGIIGICCKPIHGSYDQARRHAAKELKIEYAADAPVPISDFVVFRADGTAVRCHPSFAAAGGISRTFPASQATTHINICDAAAACETEGPLKGKGKSDGLGTYRRMEANNYQERGAFYNPNHNTPPRNTCPMRDSKCLTRWLPLPRIPPR